MRNVFQTCLRMAAVFLAASIAQAAFAGDNIIITVAPGDNLGAGFGELTPGYHTLRVTVNSFDGDLDSVNAWDTSGMTTWELETLTGSSATVVCYNAQEDEMGAVDVNGLIIDPADPTIMDSFDVGVANAVWPCAVCDVDEFGIPLCAAPNNTLTCDTSTEGEAGVLVPGDVTVAVTIHHTAPGTLTILGGTSDLEILNPDETPFTSAYVTTESSVPILIRAQPTFSGQVSLYARFLQDNAQLDTQDVLIVKAVELKVEIADANDNDLPDDNTTIVGKHIVLHGKAPANTVVTAHKWTVNGKTVKSYTQQKIDGEWVAEAKTLDDPEDLNNPTVEFYWIAGSDDPATPGVTEKFTVTYTATIGGNNISDSVKYEVLRPTNVTLTSVTTTATPAIDIRPHPLFPGEKFMMFGDQTAQDWGIDWTGKLTAPPGGAGEVGYIQLIKAVRKSSFNDNGQIVKLKLTTNNEFWLDLTNKKATTPHYDGTKPIAAGATLTAPDYDIPAQQVDAPDQLTSSVDDNFELYLMYKPDGTNSIWVTLRKLEWHWKGSATKNANGMWNMDNNTQSSSNNPGSTDSTDLPQWDKWFEIHKQDWVLDP